MELENIMRCGGIRERPEFCEPCLSLPSPQLSLVISNPPTTLKKPHEGDNLATEPRLFVNLQSSGLSLLHAETTDAETEDQRNTVTCLLLFKQQKKERALCTFLVTLPHVLEFRIMFIAHVFFWQPASIPPCFHPLKEPDAAEWNSNCHTGSSLRFPSGHSQQPLSLQDCPFSRSVAQAHPPGPLFTSSRHLLCTSLWGNTSKCACVCL
eukprot:XP_017456257.1 PREDICTED: uncharacterized protein LOC103694070 isoform X1 [Rattus norvegicus]